MTKLTSILLTSSFMLTTTASAFAGTPVVNNRQARQQTRIANGISNGELTPREVIRLETRQAQIRRAEAAAKADGKVTWAERAVLNRGLNKTNRQIHRQKHD